LDQAYEEALDPAGIAVAPGLDGATNLSIIPLQEQPKLLTFPTLEKLRKRLESDKPELPSTTVLSHGGKLS
jgi:hypothetical protein